MTINSNVNVVFENGLHITFKTTRTDELTSQLSGLNTAIMKLIAVLVTSGYNTNSQY
jgi:hypothetical protein